jgi:hypothetical protein
MRKYSDFFKTLHDEQAPTGTLGRGTHYSILRAVALGDSEGKMLGSARFADFAVIWDEDHDDRVIEPIEKIYFAGLLHHFLMFGERKGCFTAIAAASFPPHPHLQSQLNEITQRLDIEDSWPSYVVGLKDPRNPIISASDDKVSLYLSNLMMLWELGLKPAQYEGRARAAAIDGSGLDQSASPA